MEKRIAMPLTDEVIKDLKAGDRVMLNGTLYTGRDAAHKRLIEMMEMGKPLPVDLKGETIYYVGPCPAKPGSVIGSAGPTTSGRMDVYTPPLLERGMKGMVGKGLRKPYVVESIIQNKAVYFAAIGGAGALLAKAIKEAEVVAFDDLGAEAIYKLTVVDFPVTVIIDAEGNNLYEMGKKEYQTV